MVQGKKTRKQNKQEKGGQAAFRKIAPRITLAGMEENGTSGKGKQPAEAASSSHMIPFPSQDVEKSLVGLGFDQARNPVFPDPAFWLDPALQDIVGDGQNTGTLRPVFGNQRGTLHIVLQQLEGKYAHRQEQTADSAGLSNQNWVQGQQCGTQWKLGAENVPHGHVENESQLSQLQAMANGALNMDMYGLAWNAPMQPSCEPMLAGPSNTATSYYSGSSISSPGASNAFPQNTPGTSIAASQSQPSTADGPPIPSGLERDRIIAAGPPFECTSCDVVITDIPSKFTKHYKIHIRDELDHRCSICAWPWTDKRDKERHERTHTNERPYECPQCGRGFKRNDQLQRHINKVHDGTDASTLE